MAGYSQLSTDSFELKRVMRQEAHEKAFEIKVMSQRMFEKEKTNIVNEGKKNVDSHIDKMRRELQTDMNIKRSTKINKSRMKKMNVRNDLMKELISESLSRMEQDLASPDNPEYVEVLKNLVIQSMIKLMEKKVLIK
jgi:V-type H+-transporting ATPase subunit E